MPALRRPVAEDALAARAARGDDEAFAAVFEQHDRGLYDFAVRIVGDADLAADVVQVTFTRAWEQLRAGAQIANLKSWLYAVARNAAIDELRAGRRIIRLDPVDDDPRESLMTVDGNALGDPEDAFYDQEMVDLVWSSARALGPSDYALLDMHVRRDLTAQEMSDALGLRKGAVYTRLSRLKDAFEDSVVSELILRNGRRACPELDALATALDIVSLTPESHKAIQKHISRCEICTETKRRLVSPIALFRALVPVPLTPALRDQIWTAVESSAPGPASHGGGGAGRAARAGRRAVSPDRLVLFGVAALTVLAVTRFVGGAELRDPDDVHSTSHTVGVPSTDRVVDIAWSRQSDVSGYSVAWSEHEVDLPDATPELPGTSTGVSSPPLEDGRWFFHLRTRGEPDEWTSTVHVGPFVIVGAVAEAPDDRDDEVLGRRVEPEPTFDPATFPIPLRTETPPSPPEGEREPDGPARPDETPDPSPLPSPSVSSSPTPTPSPTATPTATPTPTPSSTPPVVIPPEPTPSPSPQPSPTPSATTEPTPTPSPSSSPTETPEPSPGDKPSPTPTPTESPSPNQSPNVTRVDAPDRVASGPEIVATALFVDPDHEDTHRALWEWGDGQATEGVVDPLVSGTERSVTGSHVYREAGTFTITVRVIDRAGASDSKSRRITVVEDDGPLTVAGVEAALALRAG